MKDYELVSGKGGKLGCSLGALGKWATTRPWEMEMNEESGNMDRGWPDGDQLGQFRVCKAKRLGRVGQRLHRVEEKTP